MSDRRFHDKLQELINAATLSYEERKFIFDVNDWKIKLDFLSHHDIVKSIKEKQSVFDSLDNKEEMKDYISDCINDIDCEIDSLEDEIREKENTRDRYKSIWKTLDSLK